MRPASLASALLALMAILASQGCANQDIVPSKELPVGTFQDAWRAPIVLRPGTVTIDMKAPTRHEYTPGLGEELFWMSATALLTFGAAWLAAPDVFARHQTTVLDLPPECAGSWVDLVHQAYGPVWLGPTEARSSEQARSSVLKLLEEAMRQDLARRGRALAIEVEPRGAENPQGTRALADTAKRLSAPALAVADVSFSIEPQPKMCSMQMRVSAQMHLESPGAEVAAIPGLTLDREASLPVVQWARDPEIGGHALRSLVDQLGKDILDALPKPPLR